jgi:transcriptional regulator with XRE-family HTH domain
MSISKKTDPKFEMAYDRAMLRSAFVSLFWGIISERKKMGGLTFQELAKKIGSTKHEVSRWFNGDPNWTLNTVASIANALDVELKIEAVDKSHRVFKPSGIQVSPYTSTNNKTGSKPAEQPFKVTRAANAKVKDEPIRAAQ